MLKRLNEFDILTRESVDGREELFAFARSKAPVIPSSGDEGTMLLVTRYEDVRHALEDWETFSSLEVAPVPTGISLCPIDVDPPLQADVRRGLNPMFSRSALKPYEDEMRQVARELIAKFIDRGTAEVYSEFSGPFIGQMLIKIIFSEMGPEELAHMEHVAHQISEFPSPEAFGALMVGATTYLEKAKAEGSIDPESVLGRILAIQVNGEPLPPEQQIGVLSILVLGGLDTTRAAIGNICYRMALTEGLEDRLRDPDWVRRDLDELLRLDPPVQQMCRIATKDTVLGGVEIKKGQRVMLRYDSANWDEDQFEDADKLVFGMPRPGHVSFGMGVHRCAGSNLARMQMEIAFEELLAQVKNIRLAPGAKPHWLAGQSRVLDRVDVAFDLVD